MRPEIVFVVEELRIDWRENDRASAIEWRRLGFCYSESEARRIVREGGEIEGRGWPIERGRKVPARRYATARQLDE